MNNPNHISLSEIIFAQNKFNLDILFERHPEIVHKIGSDGRERRLTTSIFSLTSIFHTNKECYHDVKILGLIKNVRTWRYIDIAYIEESENFAKWKVIVPKSNGTGAIGEVLSTPLIGEPLIGVTQSFITIGAFDNQEEAQAAFKYVRTKFARAMLGILKVTQDNSREVWRYVPLQDFTVNSDIDWSQSVPEIDRQLYAKYHLSEEEIAFIERMIKPM